jgi:HlyD family secretion protein
VPARKAFAKTKDVAGSSAAAETNRPATTASSHAGGAVLTVSGYIVNRERIEISPRFLGEVKWIGVRKGDTVTNGQVLVLLDDAEQVARIREAEGRLATAQAAAEKARLNHERIKQLIASRIETQQAEDDARLQLESARATVKEVEGVLALARTYLGWTVIKSPVNGVVLEKLVDAGELVTPQSFGGTRGPSTALLAVADPRICRWRSI